MSGAQTFLRRSWVPAEALGVAWALGLALCTSTLFLLYLCAVPWSVSVVAALTLAAAGTVLGARALAAARYGSLPADESGPAPLVAVGLGVAALQVAMAAWTALRAPLSAWDAWSIWAFKARMFAMGGPRPAYFHAAPTLFTHPDYPLNLPLAEATLFHLAGQAGVRLAALLGPACLAALLLLFYAGLTRLYGRGAAALAAGALACVPSLAMQAAGGDADVPLAMYVGAAALYLLLWWRQRRRSDAVLMGLMAGGAVWTKKEGLAVAALVLAAYGAMELLRRHAPLRERLGNALRAVLPAGALPLPWLLFSRLTHPSGRDFLPLTPAMFIAHAGRLPHIAIFFALQMLSFAHWSLLWVLLGGALLVAARRLSWSGRGLLLLLLAQVSIYMLAFVFSDWQPYTDHVRTSLDRLLVQAVPLALLLLVDAVSTLMARRAARARPAATAPHDAAA